MMKRLKNCGKAFFRDDCGATAIEYGLIASGLVMLILVSLGTVSTELKGTFNSTATALAANNP